MPIGKHYQIFTAKLDQRQAHMDSRLDGLSVQKYGKVSVKQNNNLAKY